ncbi:hypothetical protein [Tardiphaga robiniae]|uniref:hypothetical protein n=1 Tax=Tardiphaga robiniae TaxID=943830 RepID=UPI001300E514|nr:hypothetical protein [Tardiphaga robiniae]
MLKDVTKAAPLGMLAAAFIGGMLFAGRRRSPTEPAPPLEHSTIFDVMRSP